MMKRHGKRILKSCLICMIFIIFIHNLYSRIHKLQNIFRICPKSNVNISVPWWDDENLLQCSQFEKSPDLNRSNIDWYECPFEPPVGGHCGARSQARGPNQKVISYVIYGDKPGYWKGLPEILNDAAKLYPDYVVRLHIDPRRKQKTLCPLLLKHKSTFDVCDTLNLPKPLGDTSYVRDKMFWRISPYGDPQVERLLLRDSDSKIFQREVDAVNDWIKSGKLMHIMRDNRGHHTRILGGMYGIYQPNITIRKFFSESRERLFNLPPFLFDDQTYFMNIFSSEWVRENSVQHDSYLCELYPGSIPFPTQRDGNVFVGSRMYRQFPEDNHISICPEACRPKNHLNWIRC